MWVLGMMDLRPKIAKGKENWLRRRRTSPSPKSQPKPQQRARRGLSDANASPCLYEPTAPAPPPFPPPAATTLHEDGKWLEVMRLPPLVDLSALPASLEDPDYGWPRCGMPPLSDHPIITPPRLVSVSLGTPLSQHCPLPTLDFLSFGEPAVPPPAQGSWRSTREQGDGTPSMPNAGTERSAFVLSAAPQQSAVSGRSQSANNSGKSQSTQSSGRSRSTGSSGKKRRSAASQGGSSEKQPRSSASSLHQQLQLLQLQRDLQNVMHLPVAQAAQAWGLSLDSFRTLFRSVSIERWPSHKP